MKIEIENKEKKGKKFDVNFKIVFFKVIIIFYLIKFGIKCQLFKSL